MQAVRLWQQWRRGEEPPPLRGAEAAAKAAPKAAAKAAWLSRIESRGEFPGPAVELPSEALEAVEAPPEAAVPGIPAGSLCFYVLPAFLPSLLGTLRHADPKIKLSPVSSVSASFAF